MKDNEKKEIDKILKSTKEIRKEFQKEMKKNPELKKRLMSLKGV